MTTQREARDYLIQCRTAKRLTQRALAEQAQITFSMIGFVESGRRCFKLPRDQDKVDRIAKVLECDASKLVPDGVYAGRHNSINEVFGGYDASFGDTAPIIQEKKDDNALTASSSILQNEEIETITDPAMLPPLPWGLTPIRLDVKVRSVTSYVIGIDKIVCVRNRRTGLRYYRVLVNDAGFLFLRPLVLGYKSYPFKVSGEFEIIGIVTSMTFAF